VVVLQILITDPEEQRRGAGAMLTRWGLEQGDKAQLPSFVESSMAAKALYARYGFQVVTETVFDLTQYGGEGKDISTVMIRPPQRQDA
jgi:predicted N-acetyltransferase YhbS